MPRQNLSPEQRRKFEKLASDKDRGDDLVFHFFNVPRDQDHKHFEEGDEEEEEDYSSEEQPKAHSPATNSRRHQSSNVQGHPNTNPPPNGYPQNGQINNPPSGNNRRQQTSLTWFQNPADPTRGSNMTQSLTNDDSEMSFSTPNFTPRSSMSTGDQWQTANSAPPTFSNSRHNQYAPVQDVFNEYPSITPNPKYVRISMHSPKNDCWNGLCARNDPGTDENWINSRIVERQKFRVERGKLITTMNFNGQIFTSGSTVTATWVVEGRLISHQTEFRVIDNGPFDVLFGRNLLSLPEINHFRDDRVDDTPILLEQSDISPQEQEAINRNRAAADARARENEQRRRPIRPSSGTHRHSEKTNKPSAQKAQKSKGY
ncbi:hypothetical protein SBOR_7191 [Sclerotinia borealis F-4128]|uniref:Uncharacterized protein n=1 Tax=Sclerotinia borealis (strain F-4128) TaxID=1432307 RepID=W9C6P8_SCLBF|nr:hypothetical protein SBOR_7191 [Sclerotinia borealis F-4128]